MNERELVKWAKAGNEDAFAVLVQQNQGRIYNLALRMTGNPDDALELSQEAFFHAWKGLDRFQGESSFSTWLYRLTSNVCIDFLRRQHRRNTISMTVSLDEEGGLQQAELPDFRFAPETEVGRRELREAIWRGMAALPDPYRQILAMREMAGLSYTEIARRLELEEGTVKSRLARARMALRKILLADGNFFGPTSSIT